MSKKTDLLAYIEKKRNQIGELLDYDKTLINDFERARQAKVEGDKDALYNELSSINKHCQRLSLSIEKVLTDRKEIERTAYDIFELVDESSEGLAWELRDGILHIFLPYYPANTYADNLDAVHHYKVNKYYHDLKRVSEESNYPVRNEPSLLIYRYHFRDGDKKKDLDNFYTKPITDQLTKFFFRDDNYMNLAFLSDCVRDDKEGTEIIIVPNYKVF